MEESAPLQLQLIWAEAMAHILTVSVEGQVRREGGMEGGRGGGCFEEA
jgi:hypothetical protein